MGTEWDERRTLPYWDVILILVVVEDLGQGVLIDVISLEEDIVEKHRVR